MTAEARALRMSNTLKFSAVVGLPTGNGTAFSATSPHPPGWGLSLDNPPANP